MGVVDMCKQTCGFPWQMVSSSQSTITMGLKVIPQFSTTIAMAGLKVTLDCRQHQKILVSQSVTALPNSSC